MLFKPKYQYYLIPNKFRHYVRNQLSCRINNLQAGKGSPQAFKEQQQVTEKLLLALGCEPDPCCTGGDRAMQYFSPCPPPAVLVLPWIHRSCPSLQFFLGFKETQTLQNNDKHHKASWYRNRNRKLREEGGAVNSE